MKKRARWVAWLLGYHLLLTTIYLLWGRVIPTTHWSGSLLSFGLPTVQFTWSFTIALMAGPSRKHRRWYWAILLLSFIPLSFLGLLCWLAYHFVGLSLALMGLAIGLLVLAAETYTGILVGIQAYHHCEQR